MLEPLPMVVLDFRVGKQWCGWYSWPTKSAFYYSRYGREGAHYLASEFVRRSTFLFRRWLDSDDDYFDYGANPFAEYEEDSEFLVWFASLDPDSPGSVRANELMALRPGED